MAIKEIRTVLIEDSGLMRIMITDILRHQANLELIATAKNGKEGVEKVAHLRPDLVITDMVMPDMDGLGVVKKIMKEFPTPVIILSALDKTDPLVFEALNAGAFDFIDKPRFQTTIHRQEMGNLLNSIAQEAVKNRQKIHHQPQLKINQNDHVFDRASNYEILGIGASTGGPKAVESIIKRLPGNLPIPVVIAQHMSEHFIVSFAERLNQLTPLEVRVPASGEIIKKGMIYMVPGHKNTKIIRKLRTNEPVVRFTNETFEAFNYPSVDCLFSSLASTYGDKTLAVILTGMGKDGTEGLQEIKKAGGFTIAQSEASSLVFGMPKNAIEQNVIDRVIDLNEIPVFVVGCL
ncbi:chemotaxis-specific protein-glutamate methyltransferase CheB [Flexithrix dorotheae]|uniref:chemotaxis-specific protein-glutamate methyltransferase CheB n=1 Tax=Flexithrix dorotheae TaxID=70993 RepID=UPI000361763E|nr:chemotaxis-specific protein-glutamate methyltransferase CheB [Flexithrix dorotheae]